MLVLMNQDLFVLWRGLDSNPFSDRKRQKGRNLEVPLTSISITHI